MKPKILASFLAVVVAGGAALLLSTPRVVAADPAPAKIGDLNGIWVANVGSLRAAFRLVDGAIEGTAAKLTLQDSVVRGEAALSGLTFELKPGPDGSWTGKAEDGTPVSMKPLKVDPTIFPKNTAYFRGNWVVRRGNNPNRSLREHGGFFYEGPKLEGEPEIRLGRVSVKEDYVKLTKEDDNSITATIFQIDETTWAGLISPSSIPIVLAKVN